MLLFKESGKIAASVVTLYHESIIINGKFIGTAGEGEAVGVLRFENFFQSYVYASAYGRGNGYIRIGGVKIAEKPAAGVGYFDAAAEIPVHDGLKLVCGNDLNNI